ncbi:ScyD/ScyE family protein [Mumia sp. Pv 4-285]|uniref:ScyD/ScyE family protein n=1 Tax=Mumia qirimensis TaxID=3234852 RepID=UPI00351D00C2
MRRVPVLVAGAAAALSAALTISPAQAHGGYKPPKPPTPITIAEGLLSPLSLAVGHDGTTYVSQNFAGELTKVSKNGATKTLYSSGGAEVGGVSVAGDKILFAETGFSGDPENPGGFTGIKSIDKRGKVRVVADTGAYELKKNPDRKVSYGFRDISDECLAQVPQGPEYPPAKYTGDLNPHPYATVPGPFGYTFVADAGANTIQRISPSGKISTIALFPPVPAVATAEDAAGAGFPECVVGLKYYGDAVPTDLEWGPDGWLYVTLLPGGLEAPGTGAVYRVHPVTGKFKKVADGFSGATNLAVSRKGDVYVTELFANRISLLKKGAKTPTTYAEAVLPAAVEWTPKALYATTGALIGVPMGPEPPTDPPGGMVVKYPLSWGHHHR